MIALHAWHLSCRPGHARFREALQNPRAVQDATLRRYGLTRSTLRDMPITSWPDYQPWVDSLRLRGDEGSGVTHLIPTSGSGSARKLIPWTKMLGDEFRAALNAWMGDLFGRLPALCEGPAYWSITPPPAATEPDAGSRVPIEFADDSAYLGGNVQRLVAPTLAVNATDIQQGGVENFIFSTLVGLLRCENLRLMSVWHPAFVAVLLEQLIVRRTDLLEVLSPGPRRAMLAAMSWEDPSRLWPELRLVSCWGDGPAEPAFRALAERMPGVALQPKGLLATEGVVSIPFAGMSPVAVTSHVYEFIGPDGVVRWLDELCENEEYEVLLTTGGGLRRYCLNDRVQVTGWLGRTPCVRFRGRVAGRSGVVSDLVGEKLDDMLVSSALTACGKLPTFVVLQARHDALGYRLVVDSGCVNVLQLTHAVEQQLRLIHHYDVARRIGQLAALQPGKTTWSASVCLHHLAAARGQRIGELKPVSLVDRGLQFPGMDLP